MKLQAERLQKYANEGVDRMKERLQRFMMGRYGFDNFSMVLLAAAVGLMAGSLFFDSKYCYAAGLLALAYCYFRGFSRNIVKRQQEIQRFYDIKRHSEEKWSRFKYHQEQKKIYRFFRCPQCRQKVRVPKHKGKICIICPKCRMEFIRKS